MNAAQDIFKTYTKTPLGTLCLEARGDALTRSYFTTSEKSAPNVDMLQAVLQEAVQQLKAYFQGSLFTFDLPLSPSGTPFQKLIWQTLFTTSYGQTLSYQDVALKAHTPAIRAVGRACALNPLALFIPCHRAVYKNRPQIRYAWGAERKQWLLENEKANKKKTSFTCNIG